MTALSRIALRYDQWAHGPLVLFFRFPGRRSQQAGACSDLISVSVLLFAQESQGFKEAIWYNNRVV